MSTQRADAKVTLSLAITGQREDGLHTLRSEMVTVSLSDSLEFAPAKKTSITWTGTYEQSAPKSRHDLVATALAGAGVTASVTVTKEIPLSAGLGGGSADAAAALRWAGCTDLDLAASIGSDVPFCVVGGRADVSGVGEEITTLPYEERRLTLVLAPFGVSTAACYRAYDEVGNGGDEQNHLRVAAETVEPRLRALREWMATEFAQAVYLCGSGSTLFVDGHVVPERQAVLTPMGEVVVLVPVLTTPSAS